MAAKKKETGYFIVNPAGAVHSVTKEVATGLLGRVGYRQATTAEVKELNKRKGNQTAKNPICEPFTTEPTEIELEEPAGS